MLLRSTVFVVSTAALCLHASSARAYAAHTLSLSDWEVLVATVSTWRLEALYPMSIAMLGALVLGRSMR